MSIVGTLQSPLLARLFREFSVNRAPVEPKLAFHAAAAADRVLTEDDVVLCLLDGEHTQIEELVVQRAQQQAIGLDVPMSGPPT